MGIAVLCVMRFYYGNFLSVIGKTKPDNRLLTVFARNSNLFQPIRICHCVFCIDEMANLIVFMQNAQYVFCINTFMRFDFQGFYCFKVSI